MWSNLVRCRGLDFKSYIYIGVLSKYIIYCSIVHIVRRRRNFCTRVELVQEDVADIRLDRDVSMYKEKKKLVKRESPAPQLRHSRNTQHLSRHGFSHDASTSLNILPIRFARLSYEISRLGKRQRENDDLLSRNFCVCVYTPHKVISL